MRHTSTQGVTIDLAFYRAGFTIASLDRIRPAPARKHPEPEARGEQPVRAASSYPTHGRGRS
ncbi:hypothetical protein [Oricola sp.]|uniref:hypothetical protein n=1 Tax=Oricola sp. TaxID=1979950 RepID=UPI0025F24C73|nr:hypothetical protein [Oricola sp.]MCI5077849.1 hypothetical protein [Oricola sp.]